MEHLILYRQSLIHSLIFMLETHFSMELQPISYMATWKKMHAENSKATSAGSVVLILLDVKNCLPTEGCSIKSVFV